MFCAHLGVQKITLAETHDFQIWIHGPQSLNFLFCRLVAALKTAFLRPQPHHPLAHNHTFFFFCSLNTNACCVNKVDNDSECALIWLFNVFCNIQCLMCCHWELRVDSSVMGGIFFWISYFFCLCCLATVKRLENQKEHYRGITGTGNPGIFQCHLVEWFVSSLAEWSYIRSAVPYLNRKTINQPA